MACEQTAGLSKDCGHSFGGAKACKSGNFSQLTSVAIDADSVITGVTLTTGSTIYDMEFVKDTGQALEELNEAGTSSFINQTVNMQFNGVTQAKRLVIDTLSVGTFFFFIKHSDNKWYLYGHPVKTAGLEATVSTIDTGTAQADAAGATLTFVGGATGYAQEVSESVVLAL